MKVNKIGEIEKNEMKKNERPVQIEQDNFTMQ